MEIINEIGSTYIVFVNVLHQGNVAFWEHFLDYSKSCLCCRVTYIANEY